MKDREKRTLLEDAGFKLLRHQGKHEVWSNGHRKIIAPRGTGTSYRNERNFEADLRRYKREALEKEQVAASSLPAADSMGAGELKVKMGALMTVREDRRPAAEKPPGIANGLVATDPDEKKEYMRLCLGGRPLEWEAKFERRLRELHAQGLTMAEIAAKLSEEGFRTMAGTPIGKYYTQQAALRCGLRRYTKKEKEPVTQEDRVPSAAQVEVAPNPPPAPSPLPSPAPKVVQRRLPDTVMAILTDPDLSDSQKVRMILAYGG